MEVMEVYPSTLLQPSFKLELFNYQKADDKIFVCKFSKKI